MPLSLIPVPPLRGRQRCWSCWECHQHDSRVVHRRLVAECATAAIATPITTAASSTASTTAIVVPVVIAFVVVLAAVAVSVAVAAAIATTYATPAVFYTTAFNWLFFLPAAIAVAAASMTPIFLRCRF
jgi:hypothetical protein